MRIGHDALGNDAAASSKPKRRLPGVKSIPQRAKEVREAKLEAIRREKEHDGEKYSEPSTEEIEEEYQSAEQNSKLRRERREQERQDEALKKTVDADMEKQFQYRKNQAVPKFFPKRSKKEEKDARRESSAGFV